MAIYFGLYFRKKNQEDARKYRAKDLCASLGESQIDPADFIYGIWRDFSNTEMEMIVRNSLDEDIATIRLPFAQRTPCMIFETKDGSFEADVLPTWKWYPRINFHRSTDNKETLCSYAKTGWRTLRYETPGIGVFESRLNISWPFTRQAPINFITLDGKQIGFSRELSSTLQLGRLLVLPHALPLPLRCFILAKQ